MNVISRELGQRKEGEREEGTLLGRERKEGMGERGGRTKATGHQREGRVSQITVHAIPTHQ